MTTNEPMTNDELKAIRARCDAATPGPWISAHMDTDLHDKSPAVYVKGAGKDECIYAGRAVISEEASICLTPFDVVDTYKGISSHNGEFIAHARQDIPRLLAHIEWLDNLVTEYDAADPTELETEVMELSDRIIELSQTLQIKEVRIKELQSIPLEDALQAKCRKWHLACKFLVKLIKRDFDWIYRLRKSRGKGLTLDALYLYEAMADTEKNLQAKVDKLVEALRYIREEAYDTPDSWGGGIFIEDAKLKQELYKNTGLCNTWCEESVTLADYINQALKDAGEVPND